LSIAIVSSPFSAESERRREFASKCLRRIVASNDLCIAFGNDALSQLAPHLPLSKAFAVMNSILHRPILDLANSMDRRGAQTLRKVVGDSHLCRFGLGMGRGDGRVEQTVDEAFSSPWFDFGLEDVDAAIVIYSAADPWEKEKSRLLELVQRRIDERPILHGAYRDESLKDKIRLSLLLLRKP
jgi:cell division GTPase FtsZ